MVMGWHDLLFAHWPVPPDVVAATLPGGLEVDTFPAESSGPPMAWLGVVPFRMSEVRLRGLPALPGTGEFQELNLRTYVRPSGTPARGPEARPGVWFYSLDAASRLAVHAARLWFGLPYVHARMGCRVESGDRVFYSSARTGRGSGNGERAEVDVRYAPTSAPFRAAEGSLEAWLTDRFCLYAERRGQLLRGEIQHDPWPLQRATATFALNRLALSSGFELPGGEPHLLFSKELSVRAWAPERVFPKR